MKEELIKLFKKYAECTPNNHSDFDNIADIQFEDLSKEIDEMCKGKKTIAVDRDEPFEIKVMCNDQILIESLVKVDNYGFKRKGGELVCQKLELEVLSIKKTF